MGLSRITFVSDGATTLFAVNFALGYINQADVKCYVDGEVDGVGAQIYRTITFVTTNSMRISGVAPATGTRITFDRTVEKTDLLVEFVNGDGFTEDNLDLMQKQNMMVLHEAIDGRIGPIVADFSMGGFNLIDVNSLTATSITLNGQVLTATPFSVADNSVSTIKLQDLSVTTNKLAAAAVTTAKVAAGFLASLMTAGAAGTASGADVFTFVQSGTLKQQAYSTLFAPYLAKAGGTMTGALQVNSSIGTTGTITAAVGSYALIAAGADLVTRVRIEGTANGSIDLGRHDGSAAFPAVYFYPKGQASTPDIAIYGVAGTGVTGVTERGDLQINAGRLLTVGSRNLVPLNYFTGFDTNNAGTLLISVARGQCADSTGQYMLDFTATSWNIFMDGAWSAGNGGHKLSVGTSVASNSWYYVYAIMRLDTYGVDFVVDTSATVPTLPANYTVYRRIGTLRVIGGVLQAFSQVGDVFWWRTPVQDAAYTTTQSSTLTAMSLPGLRVKGRFQLRVNTSGGSATESKMTLSDPVNGSGEMFGTGSDGGAGSGNQVGAGIAECWTDTSGSINVTITGPLLTGSNLTTLGWVDNRGR